MIPAARETTSGLSQYVHHRHMEWSLVQDLANIRRLNAFKQVQHEKGPPQRARQKAEQALHLGDIPPYLLPRELDHAWFRLYLNMGWNYNLRVAVIFIVISGSCTPHYPTLVIFLYLNQHNRRNTRRQSQAHLAETALRSRQYRDPILHLLPRVSSLLRP